MRMIEPKLAAKILALDLNRSIDKAERLPYSYERERALHHITAARDILLDLSRKVEGRYGR